MSSRITSASDPYRFFYQDWNTSIFMQAMVGKTLRDPRLVPGERTGVFITCGQSLAAGTCEGLHTPTNANKVDAISIYDGGLYAGLDPLVGHGLADSPTQRACAFTRVADQLITNGKFDRVILIPVAVGGTTVAQWDTGGGWVGEPLHRLILVAGRRARALGLPITALLWQQGETDFAAGTTGAQYVSRFNSVKAKVAAEIDAPWFVATSTYLDPPGATSADLRAAQQSLVNGVDVFAGPDSDTLNTSYRYDNQHWNAAGNAAISALWTAAVSAAL